MRKLLLNTITFLGLLTACLITAQKKDISGDYIILSGGAAIVQTENVVSREVIYIHGDAQVVGLELQKSMLLTCNTNNQKSRPKTAKIDAVNQKLLMAKQKADTQTKAQAPTKSINEAPSSDADSLFYTVHATLVSASVPIGCEEKIGTLLSLYSQNLQPVFPVCQKKKNYSYLYSTSIHFFGDPALYSRPPTA